MQTLEKCLLLLLLQNHNLLRFYVLDDIVKHSLEFAYVCVCDL